MLLHYNNEGRDPRDGGEKFFAGHWIYYNGSRITADVPAQAGETEIAVADPQFFRLDIGPDSNRRPTAGSPPLHLYADDIGLCMLDATGKPDWSRSEQLQLVSIDAQRKTIRVRRGCYKTQPQAFPAGHAYAAAHVTQGPYMEVNQLGGDDAGVTQGSASIPMLRRSAT